MEFRKRRPIWRANEDATTADLMGRTDQPPASPPAEGLVVFVDENGRQRRLPADLSELSTEERDAAIGALSGALGARPDVARMAAIERLTELRAAGTITEEQFTKERRRLEDY